MAIAVDASSPVRVAGTTANITTAPFTPPANSLLVACLEFDGQNASPADAFTLTTTGLVWTLQVVRDNLEATVGGSAQIYTAPQVSSAGRTVDAAYASGGSGSAHQKSLKVYVVTGADIAGTPVDTVGANNEGGSATNNLTTTPITPGADGLLFAADCDWSQLGVFDASSDLTQDTADYPGTISVCDGYKAVSNGVSATANLNAAGSGTPQHKWVQIIVRAAAGGGGGTDLGVNFGEPMVGSSLF